MICKKSVKIASSPRKDQFLASLSLNCCTYVGNYTAMVSHIYMCNSIIQKIKCQITLIGERNKKVQFTYHSMKSMLNPRHTGYSQHVESTLLTTRNFNIQFFTIHIFFFCEVTRQNKNMMTSSGCT